MRLYLVSPTMKPVVRNLVPRHAPISILVLKFWFWCSIGIGAMVLDMLLVL